MGWDQEATRSVSMSEASSCLSIKLYIGETKKAVEALVVRIFNTELCESRKKSHSLMPLTLALVLLRGLGRMKIATGGWYTRSTLQVQDNTLL